MCVLDTRQALLPLIINYMALLRFFHRPEPVYHEHGACTHKAWCGFICRHSSCDIFNIHKELIIHSIIVKALEHIHLLDIPVTLFPGGKSGHASRLALDGRNITHSCTQCALTGHITYTYTYTHGFSRLTCSII